MLPYKAIEIDKLTRRSPAQVAVLTFVTLELYLVFWSFFVLRDAKLLLEDEREQPVWYSLGLLVPFLNFVLVFRLFERVRALALRAQLGGVPTMLGALGFASLVIALLGRLPVPYDSIAMLSFIPVAYAQTFVVRSEFVLSGERAIPQHFGWVELVVISLGVVFRALIMVGYTFGLDRATNTYALRSGAWFAWLLLAVSIAAYIVIARMPLPNVTAPPATPRL